MALTGVQSLLVKQQLAKNYETPPTVSEEEALTTCLEQSDPENSIQGPLRDRRFCARRLGAECCFVFIGRFRFSELSLNSVTPVTGSLALVSDGNN